MIICGDALIELRKLPDESVHCCVTSPPYWGLRDYGTAKWEGGDADCDHKYKNARNDPDRDTRHTDGRNPETQGLVGCMDAIQFRDVCPKCGAIRTDSQLGLERTPEEYVAKIVEVFREVRRVLRKDGTLWLNLGDSYCGSWGNSGHRPEIDDGESHQREKNTEYINRGGWDSRREVPPNQKIPGLKPKDLVGIPWRVAFALQADGWYLRQDIIWAKPNPMPESVTDRCTKAHEYIFLLAKSQKYYYDAKAIKEPAIYANDDRIARAHEGNKRMPTDRISGIRPYKKVPSNWDTDPGSHGTIHRKGRADKQRGHGRRHAGFNDRWDVMTKGEQCSTMRNKRDVWIIATDPFTEAHFATFPPALIEPCILAGCPRGGIVLDPFFGAGTAGLVAKHLGRDFIGIDLNSKYCEMARKRIYGDLYVEIEGRLP